MSNIINFSKEMISVFDTSGSYELQRMVPITEKDEPEETLGSVCDLNYCRVMFAISQLGRKAGGAMASRVKDAASLPYEDFANGNLTFGENGRIDVCCDALVQTVGLNEEDCEYYPNSTVRQTSEVRLVGFHLKDGRDALVNFVSQVPRKNKDGTPEFIITPLKTLKEVATDITTFAIIGDASNLI